MLFRDFIHQLIVAPLAVVFLLRRDPIVPHSVEGMLKNPLLSAPFDILTVGTTCKYS
jgi:hypothetical protein